MQGNWQQTLFLQRAKCPLASPLRLQRLQRVNGVSPPDTNAREQEAPSRPRGCALPKPQEDCTQWEKLRKGGTQRPLCPRDQKVHCQKDAVPRTGKTPGREPPAVPWICRFRERALPLLWKQREQHRCFPTFLRLRAFFLRSERTKGAFISQSPAGQKLQATAEAVLPASGSISTGGSRAPCHHQAHTKTGTPQI